MPAPRPPHRSAAAASTKPRGVKRASAASPLGGVSDEVSRRGMLAVAVAAAQAGGAVSVRLQALGLSQLSAADGMAALEAASGAHAPPVLCAVAVSWRRFVRGVGCVPALLQRVAPAMAARDTTELGSAVASTCTACVVLGLEAVLSLVRRTAGAPEDPVRVCGRQTGRRALAANEEVHPDVVLVPHLG